MEGVVVAEEGITQPLFLVTRGLHVSIIFLINANQDILLWLIPLNFFLFGLLKDRFVFKIGRIIIVDSIKDFISMQRLIFHDYLNAYY